MGAGMARAGRRPTAIEAQVRLGEDIGITEGLRAAREMLLDALELRGFALPPALRERVAAERSLDRLRGWCRAALQAESIETVLAE
jgi:hypothetical protein